MAVPTNGTTIEGQIGGVPGVRTWGLNTAQASNLAGMTVDTSGNLAVPGTATVTGVLAVTGTSAYTGAQTATGGIVGPGTLPTVWHSGGFQPYINTTGTNVAGVTTVTWWSEVFIPVNCTLTGVSVLNGNAVAGNLTVALSNSAGTIVASSTTGTAASGTQAYQQVPFSAQYAAVGPAKYYTVLQMSNTGYNFKAHQVGNFGVGTATTTVYGTIASITASTT